MKLAAGLALAVTATPALAHHVVSEYGIAWVEPRSVVEVDVQAASFSLGGREGAWQTLTPSLEYVAVPRLSLMARLPLARLDERGRAAVVGIGNPGRTFRP